MDKKKAILLRIPPELWEALNAWARDDLRSVNAQIEYLLREAVRKRTGKPLPDSTNADEAESPPANKDDPLPRSDV